MGNTRVSQRVNAPRERVYRALLDPRAIATWRVPDGMTSRVHSFDGAEGRSFRISRTYDAPTSAGEPTEHTNSYYGHFVKLVPNELVVEAIQFETTDPELLGEMTITTTLTDSGNGTDVVVFHERLPSGVSSTDNETGTRLALARLAEFVEGGLRTFTPSELARVSWADYARPPESKDGDISAALRALAETPENDDYASYNRVLAALGNNHAGTYYPIALPAVQFLGQIVNGERVAARVRALDVLVELVGSFNPEPGFEKIVTRTGERSLSTVMKEAAIVFAESIERLRVRAESAEEAKLCAELLALLRH